MSELPNIQILSRDLMRGVLRRALPSHIHHIVSISDPDDGPPQEVRDREGSSLILTFHDTSNSNDEDLLAPTRDDVLKIVSFAEKVSAGENVLCHCNAGISRSSAAALTILAAKLDPSAENAEFAVSELMRIKSLIHPNKLMVSFADDVLGYEGSLIAAHASTFGGGDLFFVP